MLHISCHHQHICHVLLTRTSANLSPQQGGFLRGSTMKPRYSTWIPRVLRISQATPCQLDN
jgi:hypothetical protein